MGHNNSIYLTNQHYIDNPVLFQQFISISKDVSIDNLTNIIFKKYPLLRKWINQLNFKTKETLSLKDRVQLLINNIDHLPTCRCTKKI